MLTKPYPKDNEPRTLGLSPELTAQLGAPHLPESSLKPGDLLFATRDGTPMSRNTFALEYGYLPSPLPGVDFDVRVHDLRHAHASWLLAWRLRPQVRRGPHGPRPDHHHPEVHPHSLPDADKKNLKSLPSRGRRAKIPKPASDEE